jgi:putative ABC transport system substrate-binding protein
MERWRADAVIVQPSLPHAPAAALALSRRLPAFAPNTNFPAAGGLMSYSADQLALYRESAAFVDKILKGRRPADLPVQLPTKFRLVVNLKTAKALGLTVPPTLLTRADDVIE